MRTRSRKHRNLVRTMAFLASSAVVFQASGCLNRDVVLGALADSLALTVAAAAQSLLVGVLNG